MSCVYERREKDIMEIVFCRFMNDEEGATALEYGLLAALIASVIVAAVTTLGQVVRNTFNTIATNMAAAS